MRWEGKGLSYLGAGAACRPQPGASSGATLAPGQAPSRPAGVAPRLLGWEPGHPLGRGAGKDSRDPCPPPTSSMVRCWNRGPHCGSGSLCGSHGPCPQGEPLLGARGLLSRRRQHLWSYLSRPLGHTRGVRARHHHFQ